MTANPEIGNDKTVELSAYAADIEGYRLVKTQDEHGHDVAALITKETSDGWDNSYLLHFYDGVNAEAMHSVQAYNGYSTTITYIYEKNGTTPGGDNPGGNDPIGDFTIGGNSNPAAVLDLDELPKVESAKTLTPNDDGTYTLKLEVKVPELKAVNKNRANIVIVFDSSNSMNRARGYTRLNSRRGHYPSGQCSKRIRLRLLGGAGRPEYAVQLLFHRRKDGDRGQRRCTDSRS